MVKTLVIKSYSTILSQPSGVAFRSQLPLHILGRELELLLIYSFEIIWWKKLKNQIKNVIPTVTLPKDKSLLLLYPLRIKEFSFLRDR